MFLTFQLALQILSIREFNSMAALIHKWVYVYVRWIQQKKKSPSLFAKRDRNSCNMRLVCHTEFPELIYLLSLVDVWRFFAFTFFLVFTTDFSSRTNCERMLRHYFIRRFRFGVRHSLHCKFNEFISFSADVLKIWICSIRNSSRQSFCRDYIFYVNFSGIKKLLM